jgi:carboxylesterase 2
MNFKCSLASLPFAALGHCKSNMTHFLPLSVLAVLVAIGLIAPSHAQLYDKIIQTQYGPVQGFKYFDQWTLQICFNVSANNVAAYLGIPLAANTGYQNRRKAS